MSLFLVVVPWIPPPNKEADQYEGKIAYYLAPLIGCAFFVGGAFYWLIWYVIIPAIGNYRLVPVQNVLADSTVRTVFEKRPRHPTEEEAKADAKAEDRARRLVQAHSDSESEHEPVVA